MNIKQLLLLNKNNWNCILQNAPKECIFNSLMFSSVCYSWTPGWKLLWIPVPLVFSAPFNESLRVNIWLFGRLINQASLDKTNMKILGLPQNSQSHCDLCQMRWTGSVRMLKHLWGEHKKKNMWSLQTRKPLQKQHYKQERASKKLFLLVSFLKSFKETATRGEKDAQRQVFFLCLQSSVPL